MGTFKEKKGKTRIGLFLQNIAPDLLNIAGSLTGINALDKIGEAIGGSSKLTAEQRAEALELLKLDIENERERTKRHEIDMSSDSWLSKNVRPMTLIFLMALLTITVIWDAASESFSVEEAYILLMKTLMITVFVFYFGGREVQKAILNRK